MSPPPAWIPANAIAFTDLLSEIGENVIVILSTHIVEDVMELCTNMAIIHQGKVLFAGAPADAVKGPGRAHLAEVNRQDRDERLRAALQGDFQQADRGQAAHPCHADQNPGDGFQPVTPDLEDVFFTRIGGIQ